MRVAWGCRATPDDCWIERDWVDCPRPRSGIILGGPVGAAFGKFLRSPSNDLGLIGGPIKGPRTTGFCACVRGAQSEKNPIAARTSAALNPNAASITRRVERFLGNDCISTPPLTMRNSGARHFCAHVGIMRRLYHVSAFCLSPIGVEKGYMERCRPAHVSYCHVPSHLLSWPAMNRLRQGFSRHRTEKNPAGICSLRG